MNHLLYGLSLVIALNAQECNEGEKEGNGTTTETTVPATPTDDKPAIEVKDGAATSEITGRRWYVISVNGGELIAPEGGERPWIELADGRIQGFGGCNNLMGAYISENDRLSFNEIGSTKKYCPDVQATERSIIEMLSTVSNYQVEGGTLTMMQGTNVVAVLKVKE
jgi:heat shock protein HslJ